MKEAADKYLEHLDNIFRVEPTFFKYSDEGVWPPCHSLIYRDIPEAGMTTGFTCGVSFVEQPVTRNVRPELMICVDTKKDAWVLALTDIGYQHRGKYNFKPGNTINFNSKISEESDMTSFLIWYQSVIHEDYEIVCLPDWNIEFLQLFPVHDDERKLICQNGPEWLFDLVEDPCDVRRSSVAHRFKI